MPSDAVLGATGHTGQSLPEALSQSPGKTIYAHVRSKSKLLRLNPELSSAKNVKVGEGDLQDVDLISDCISGTRAVCVNVALSDNMPGCRIAQDTAHVVVVAVEELCSND